MTRNEAVDYIAQRIGRRNDLATQIIMELRMAQMQEESVEPLPWFLFKRAPITLNAEYVALPSDFIREQFDGLSEGAILMDDDTVLEKTDFETARGVTGTGRPKVYTLLGSELMLRPVPDTTYNATYFYYAHDQVLSTDIENQWLKYAPEVLISRAAMEMALFIRELGLVDHFSTLYRAAREDLDRLTQSRALTSARLLRIGG